MQSRNVMLICLIRIVIFASLLSTAWADPFSVTVDISSVAKKDIELEFSLFNRDGNAGESYLLIDNVFIEDSSGTVLGPGQLDFEDNTLEGFDTSLNPNSVSVVPGAFPGDQGNHQLRIAEEAQIFVTITHIDFAGAQSSKLRFDFELVTADGSPDIFVASLLDPNTLDLSPFATIPGLSGFGDLLEASGTENLLAEGVTIKPITTPHPELSIVDPTQNQIFPSGTTQVTLVIDQKHHTGQWHWQLNSPFPQNGQAGGNIVQSGNTTTITGLSDGTTYTVYVALTDDQGQVLILSVTASATFSIALPTNNPPVWREIPAALLSLKENESLLLNLLDYATDVDNDSLTFTVENSPPGSTFDGKNFAWTPDFNQAGKHSVTFTVTDGNVESPIEQTVEITVTDVNRAPQLTHIGNQEVQVEQTLSLTLNAIDSDGNTLKFSAQNLPE